MNEDRKSRQSPSDPDTGFDAESAQKQIAGGASHRRADRDSKFLDEPELRSVRLQLEYLKPELAFKKLVVHSTIVVFGSTTLVDPEDAQR